MNGCSDQEYAVTLLVPLTYVLMAPDAELAEAAVLERWQMGVLPNVVGIPEASVKEVDSPARVAG